MMNEKKRAHDSQIVTAKENLKAARKLQNSIFYLRI